LNYEMSTDVECSDPEIIKAFREVQNEKSSIKWAVFGYVPKTNKLKLDATGSGDIDELREELSDGKVQYAAYRVQDEKTNLGKVVFINWVGEGVAESRKGATSAHVPKIALLLKGFHVQVNARNENDLDGKALKEKVTKAAGAYYTAHKEGKEGQSKTAGGDDKPQSQTQKDSSVKADTAGIKQKFQNIKAANEQQPAPRPVPKPVMKVSPPVQQEAAAPPKPLAAPKPIGKVNAFQPATTFEPPKPAAPKPKFTPKPPEPEPAYEPEPEPAYEPEPEPEPQQPIEPEPQIEEQYQQPEEQFQQPPPVQSGSEIYSARALYDFEAQDETELDFKEGDIIKVINQIDDAWYEGERDGKVGMFPVEYVEILN